MIAMEIIFFERAKNKMGFCKAFFGYSNDDFFHVQHQKTRKKMSYEWWWRCFFYEDQTVKLSL